MSAPLFLQIHPADNVAVALEDLPSGEVLCHKGAKLRLADAIPFGHKFSLTPVPRGTPVIKYGHSIGLASTDIFPGSHVHSHNLSTGLSGLLDYTYRPREAVLPKIDPIPTFQGYLRPDGRAATRNEVWVLPTVGCVNGTAKLLAERANNAFGNRCDGVFAFPHNMGCSQLGDDFNTTQRLLAGLAANPNAAGVLVLGLGCENNHIEAFRPFLEGLDPQKLRFLSTQETGDELAWGLGLLDELTGYAQGFRRQALPLSMLTIGLKCGGSDGFSGITANPLCGRITDRLAAMGSKVILTEVPEMFGAETLLMERAVSAQVFEQTVSLINDYKSYFLRHGQPVYENPSPGNKQGGVTTLEEKSLGCVQKGGHAPVTGVLNYGEQPASPGLNLLTGSGNDQVSITNMAASGAVLLLFTTGRGNPLGGPVPTLKIASNSRLAGRKSHWIDYDAGQVLHGVSPDDSTDRLLQLILQTASGQALCNEHYGYREISIFRDGVIL